MEIINDEVSAAKKEVTSTSEDELGLSNEFISNFKAMYYTLNATPDTQMKVFNEGKIITLDNIKDLFSKVNEKMENHDTIIDKVTIFVAFDDGRNEELSLPEFIRKDWKISSSTKSVNINWDFYIKLPNYEVPQRHSLSVRMGSKLRPDEFFKIMMESNSDSEINSMMADVVCRVDFVNAVLAEELMNRVEEWYKSLKEDDQKSELMIFVHKHSYQISKFIEIMFPIIALLIIYGWTRRFLSNYNVSGIDIISSSEQLTNLLLWFVISIIFIMILRYVGLFIASMNHRKSKSFIEYSYILITSGDANRREKAKKNNKSLLRNIGYNLIGSLLTTIIVSIWGVII